MPKSSQSETLELNQDMEFQKRSWAVQRAGWVVMLLFVLAGMAGLFGGGLASSATAGEEGAPLRIEYERFARVRSPTSVTIQAAAPATDSSVRIWLNRSWLAAHEIHAVTPEPVDTRLADQRVTYEFRMDESMGAALIVFDVKPRRAGRILGRVGVEGGPALSFRQLVYP